MNYSVIILVCVVLLLLYILYKYVFNRSLVKGLIKLDQEKMLTEDKLNNPKAKNYYYEFWTFINQVPTGKSPFIYREGDIGIWLTAENQLVLVKNSPSGATTYTPTDVLFTIIQPFPFQKWIHVTVNVINHGQTDNSTTIECYINGKLVITKPNLAMYTPTPKGSFYMGRASGLNGYITRIQRVPQNIAANEVWDHYVQGNGLTGISQFFAQYHIDMNVTKDQVLQRNVRLL